MSGYSHGELETWAERIQKWSQTGRDVFVYFDNDVKVRAPFDARNLASILAKEPTLAAPATLDSVTEEARTTWPAWGQRRAR